MSEKKNIDRLFQERFKDFEVNPSEQVWDNIESELNKKKKKRVIPFWIRLSGIAAALLIGILVAMQFIGANNGTDANDGVVQTNDTIGKVRPGGESPVNTSKSVAVGDDISPDNNASGSEKNPQIDVQPNNKSTADENGSLRQDKKTENYQKDVATAERNRSNTQADPDRNTTEKEVHLNPVQKVAAADQPKNETKNGVNRSQNLQGDNNNLALNQNAKAENAEKSSDVAAISDKNKQVAKSPVPKDENSSGLAIENSSSKDNLKVDATIPETSNLTKTDTIAIATVVPNALEELLNEKEEKQLTTVEQKLNRWQITSNVAPIYFGSFSEGSPLDSRFESNDKAYKPTLSYGAGVEFAVNKKFAIRSGVNSVALEYNTTDVIFFQTPNARKIQNVKVNLQGSLIQVDNTPIPMNATLGRTIKQYNGSLTQKTGYIEVPVEMSYKVIDKKFGLQVIGGLSTLFLNENEISIVGQGLEMNIGEANNLSDVHFSTNIGLGLKYDFLKSFQVHMEPTFKYQINTFSNNDGNFKPYFFGLYTGLSYRF
jgi:hypothetical protein